jgi:hypothetical protein
VFPPIKEKIMAKTFSEAHARAIEELKDERYREEVEKIKDKLRKQKWYDVVFPYRLIRKDVI